MSAIIKCLMAICLIFAFVQFVEMARVRREESKPAGNDVDLSKSINELVDKLKLALDDESVKKVINAASQAISDGQKAVKQQFEEITAKLGESGKTGQ